MTNAEAWFNIALRPRKPEGSLGRTAQDGHLDSHASPELCQEPLTARILDILSMYNLQKTVVHSTHTHVGHVIEWMIACPNDGILQSTEIPKGLESDHRSRCALIHLDVSSSRPLPVYRLGGSVRGTARVAFKRGL